MADLVDSVLAKCGIIPEPEPADVVASHGAFAEQHRLELLRLLQRGEAQMAMLTSLITSNPDDDQTFDLVDGGLGQTIAAAGLELRRFRDRRECEGCA